MNIRAARHDAGLTLDRLSEITGINVRQIQKYERGEYAPENMTLKNAIALSKALGIEPKDLLKGE